jgi:hypothetical protein
MCNRILFFLLINIINFNLAWSANQSIGSNFTTGAPQGNVLFTGNNNIINNYALMDNGFTLQDHSTSLSFDSIFLVNGNIFLDKGKLFLFKNLSLGGNSYLYSNGFIDSNSNYIAFDYVSKFFGPSCLIANLNEKILSIDWSFDNECIGVGSETKISFLIYDDSIYLPSAYDDSVVDLNSLKFRPSGLDADSYQMGAVDGSTFYNLGILSFDGTSVGFLGGKRYNPEPGKSVSWYHDGRFLAFGIDNSSVRIVDVPSNGYIYSSPVIRASGGASTPNSYAINSFSWSGENKNNLAAGFDDTLEVYTFIPFLSLLYSTKQVVGNVISGVDWHPSGSFIAVGLNGSSNNLRLYDFTYTLSLLTEVNVGFSVQDDVSALGWSKDGKYLSVVTQNNFNSLLKTYVWKEFSQELVLDKTFVFNDNINAISWSGDSAKMALGGDVGLLYVLKYFAPDPLYFKDSNLIFDSNFDINQPIVFEGNCSINSKGNYLKLTNNSYIELLENSFLTIKNSKILGLNGSNIFSTSHSSEFSFENVELGLNGNFSFSYGSIFFSSGVSFNGEGSFIYGTNLVSTIDLNSTLKFNNGTKFIYSPGVARNDLIYMCDNSSVLYFDNADLYTTGTGILLRNGSLCLDNAVTFSSQGKTIQESICLRTGSRDGSLNLNVLSSAQRDIYGVFYLDNESFHDGTLYKSFFQSESLAEWTEIYGNIDRWNIVGNEMRNNSGSQMSIIMRGNLNWTNYTLQALVKRTNTSTMGIMFYYQDNSNFWRYLSESGYMLIRGNIDDEWTNAGDLPDTAFAVDDTVSDSWYWYKAQVDNGWIRVKHWLDGDVEPTGWETEVFDNRILSGSIGLMGWSGGTQFKDIWAYENS